MSSETNELDEFYSALQSDDTDTNVTLDTTTNGHHNNNKEGEDKHGIKRKLQDEEQSQEDNIKNGDSSSSTSSSTSTSTTPSTSKMIPSSLIKKKQAQLKKKPTPSMTSVISSKAVTYSASTISKLQESNEVKVPSYVTQVMREKPLVTMEDPKKVKYTMGSGNQTWEDATLSEWNPNDFRLFVGQLGNEVTDEMLAQAFSRYPSFEKARVIRDKKTQKTKGYGFVAFTSNADYLKAFKEMNGKYVGNRPLVLKKSNWKDRAVSEQVITPTPTPTPTLSTSMMTGTPATLYQQFQPRSSTAANKNSLYKKF